jgi:AcrR family transcriptional regulator
MTSIVRGSRELTGAAPAVPLAAAAPVEDRLAAALLRCIARWGLTKTTIEDIAREAGVSRATAYRVFPGGKAAILDAAVRAEVRTLAGEVMAKAGAAGDAEQCVVAVLVHAYRSLSGHPALRFMLDHEPVVLEQYLGFERQGELFVAAGELLSPALGDHLPERETGTVAVWLCRLVLSYLQTPSPALDLTSEADVRRLVRTFVLPGLRAAAGLQITGSTSDSH